MRETGTIADYR